MKKLLTFIFLFISVLAFSQNNGINFQGVGRNSSGAVMASQKISLRFTVIQGSETGPVEYLESKEVTTNARAYFRWSSEMEPKSLKRETSPISIGKSIQNS